MGLLEGITEPGVKRTSCQVRTVLEQLEPSDQKILQSWLAAVGVWSGAAVSNALKSKGLQCGTSAVIKHRKGMCSC